jgi:hypothetical protein
LVSLGRRQPHACVSNEGGDGAGGKWLSRRMGEACA